MMRERGNGHVHGSSCEQFRSEPTDSPTTKVNRCAIVGWNGDGDSWEPNTRRYWGVVACENRFRYNCIAALSFLFAWRPRGSFSASAPACPRYKRCGVSLRPLIEHPLLMTDPDGSHGEHVVCFVLDREGFRPAAIPCHPISVQVVPSTYSSPCLPRPCEPLC